MTPLTDAELDWIAEEFGERMPNTVGRLIADLKAARAAIARVVEAHDADTDENGGSIETASRLEDAVRALARMFGVRNPHSRRR